MNDLTTTPKPDRVKIDDAEFETLKHFATVILGIEIKDGTNGAQIRAKIRAAMPNADTIPLPPPPPEPIVPPVALTNPIVQQALANPVKDENPLARPAAVSLPASAELQHASRDPKVGIRFHKTDDKRRSRDVTIGVNGDIYRCQRGVDVKIPYRVYLAVLDAKEHIAVDSDEINPATGEPFKVWEEVYSYPFTVNSMPSDAEINDWLARTGAGFKNAA
ncbi:hypothetical protein F1640_18355 [Novosphingobium sp. NBM11]|uniref:hypothetical protein n=1 Tax=Novosphingobium sp. NBM11 TaxID=2596914 RepID=UPI0018920A38|nr:hypothetical protein [Novosphingobium sp. NBM11]MBF5091918.1 hypothetical protein [Novosphingobium sp. NBM11]